MRIGVLKERKRDERRVALRPEQAKYLIGLGHEVFIEKDAGTGAGFENERYKGCRIVDRGYVYENCTLLLKVKCPQEGEFKYLKSGHILFTFLHFDENISPENIMKLVDTGMAGIAYEWVGIDGRFPILKPMSEITGKLFAYKSMELLMEESAILPGAFKDAPCVNAMVIGAGSIGSKAIKVLASNGFKLTIVDKHPATLLNRLGLYTGLQKAKVILESSRIITLDEQDHKPAIYQINQYLPDQHIVINAAVRRPSFPKNVCEYIIDEKSVKAMRKRSILCDATACDKDLIETAVSSESLSRFYTIDDVIHYNCDHIPSLVSSTSTYLLTEAVFPYILRLAGGFERAVNKDFALFKGVMCYKGNCTHEYSAAKKNLKYKPLSSLLSSVIPNSLKSREYCGEELISRTSGVNV